MIVCIAEKPSVAREIAQVLGATGRRDGYYEGNGYQVTWAYGHLCQLKEPADYNPEWRKWRLDTLPMIPEHYGIKPIEDKTSKAQLRIIKTLFKYASEIINCGDAGQEGELIQRWIQQCTGVVRCPVKRLWVSSLTTEAIKEAFQHLKPQSDYDNLYHAGLARSIADKQVGVDLSRAYTLVYTRGIGNFVSVGRVMTPTLALIVKRQDEIDNFVPKPYWVLVTKYRGTTFNATRGKLATEQEANDLFRKISGNTFTITHVDQKQGKESSPQLYDLTSLQVDCNKLYGYTAAETLATIQSLYEKKLSTYPRVDTRYLTDDIYNKCQAILNQLSWYELQTKQITQPLSHSKRIFDNAKVTDHHAIIPTGERASTLSDKERQVYDLICRRFISVFLPDCVYATTTVTGKAGEEQFKATGKQVLSLGWRVTVHASAANNKQNRTDSESTNDNTMNSSLPAFKEGETGPHTPQIQQKMTTAPEAYTEGSLLRAMETAGKQSDDPEIREAMKENGIGRPSSRAAIIEKLVRTKLIAKVGKSLRPTDVGKQLISIINAPMLTSVETTGRWEQKLREIEKGNLTDKQFIDDITQQIREIISDVKNDHSGRVITFPTNPQAPSSSSQKNKIHGRRPATHRKKS